MSTYTTGLMANVAQGGTAAAQALLYARNLGPDEALVVVQVFGIPIGSSTLSPIYVAGFMVPSNSAVSRSFVVSGLSVYEMQLNNVDDLSEMAMSVNGVDSAGNLVPSQRILPLELSPMLGLAGA
ncbi:MULTISPECIES: hypothetical protein [unclassified Paenibacillus]|uniref:hypothetical protein n=1 Tax=unclassified Paenibacillus TaxID=185978 RepID=UPI000954DE7D|nr:MULTISPECIES: hypothetical protein [unclassified Paenibacillus]ASS65509.1 hypothetical protein CIC07_04735 [Paenibacillus sp. RUD330]SIQ33783.1 hypothetical protein SAMN05880555_1415 [Paenibacillus sp. RU4X]SIQ55478.1 hypothetical protein SAMN05880570_1413 [Paenibacillus sp. RU4T]